MQNSTEVQPNSTELATLGPVHLDVIDADRSLAFWKDLVGLRQRGEDQGGLLLGTESETLIVLHPGATQPEQRGYAGLFHVALHLPNDAEFARAIARLIARRVQIGSSDHVMHQAIYLRDPNGLGLELTLETPERLRELRVTPTGVEVVDTSGGRSDGRNPLDFDQILSALPDDDLELPLPAGTTVGHLNLHVGDLAAAQHFYRDVLGLRPGVFAPVIGLADFHAGGFEHRLAVNTWQGPGVSQPPAGTAALREFTIRFDTPERLEEVLSRIQNTEPHRDGVLARDPSGNAMVLTA